MKLGILKDAYLTPDGKTDYAKFKEHGYDCLDSNEVFSMGSIYYKMTEEERKYKLIEERKRVEDAGLECCQVHGPWPVDDTTPESRAIKEEYVKVAIRAAHYLDGKHLVLHPAMLQDKEGNELPGVWEENERYFRTACEYAKDYGIKICMENVPYRNYSLATVKQISDFIDATRIPNLAMCYDTGHEYVAGEKDPIKAIKTCGDKLATLHVHDCDSVCDRHWFFYRGEINWNGFGKALVENGYKGTFSLEVCARHWTRIPDELKEYYAIALAKTAKYISEN